MKTAFRLLSLLLAAAAISACSVSPTAPPPENQGAFSPAPPLPPPVDPGGNN